jgi:hypothetical protein
LQERIAIQWLYNSRYKPAEVLWMNGQEEKELNA